MLKTQETPWSFTIVFDEGKAAKNGYNINELYDYVGKNIEHFGNERVDRGTWRVKKGCDEVEAQCLALSTLSRAKWVMQNISSLTFFEDDAEPNDFLAVVRRRNPERIYG